MSSVALILNIWYQLPLEPLHIDFFGTVKITNFGGKQYGFFIVHDFSKFTWLVILKHKDESFEEF